MIDFFPEYFVVRGIADERLSVSNPLLVSCPKVRLAISLCLSTKQRTIDFCGCLGDVP